MQLYGLFLLMATLTVLSPGPGVVMTLSNSLRSGVRGSVGGILGIASGTFLVASVSATGVGVLLATSAVAFTVLKFVGAGYLVYLGIRLWRSPAVSLGDYHGDCAERFRGRFIRGVMLQLTNPKVVVFFLSVFPQFIDPTLNYSAQFTMLVCTYSALVVVIHCLYALIGQRAKRWFRSPMGARLVNRLGGATFVCFGVALTAAKR